MLRMKKKPTAASPSSSISSPRSRKRSGKSTTHAHNDTRRGTITLSEGSAPEYQPMSFSGFAPRIRGAKIRNSKRWIHGTTQPLTGLSFPYIDHLGRYTGTTLFKWSCDPRSFVASVVSTIANRAFNRAVHYNGMKLALRSSERIIRAAFYYATSKNNYFWDRILFFLKNLKENGNLMSRFVLKWNLKTDENKRFVYSHVCSQTQWLLFRVERPRDKSAIMKRALPLLSFERGDSAFLKMGGILADLAKAMSSIYS